MKTANGLRIAVLACAAVAAALITAPSALAATTQYAIGKPLCKAPQQGLATCFAERKVLVKQSTPGARPFKPGAGATPTAVSPNAQTIGPAGGITPFDLATAYGFNSLASASSQTVGIVDAFDDPTIESNLQTFDSQYGLATCTTANGCFKKVNQTGAASPLPAVNTGWAGEIALDVETVHSVCQTCHILLVEANTNSFANLEASVNEAAALHATEISNSYGGAATPSSSDLAVYNHPGVVIAASTGDDGWYDFDQYALGGAGTNPGLPAFPASANTVVAVGGTSLFLGQGGSRQSESVWNDNGTKDYFEQNFAHQPLGATGGGCSTTIQAQGWQAHVPGWSNTACGKFRLDADVSSDADYLTGIDTYDTTGGSGWSTIGGTSFSSPTIAGMFALAGGAHGVNYPAATLYAHNGSSSLYDVTVGGNGYCGGTGAAGCGNVNNLGFGPLDCDYNAAGTAVATANGACDAAPGYDGPSGLGTPNGLTAFAATAPAATITGPVLASPGTAATFNATVTDPFPGGAPASYTWNWGDGTTPTTVSSTSLTNSTAHTYTIGGVNRTITLSVKDNYGVIGTKTYVVSVCCAANGTGTLTANTTSVVHATGAHTIAFTYTPAAGGMQSGAVTLAVPAGWSAPSATTSAAGYTTASGGTVSVSGQTITVSGISRATSQPLTITYGARGSGGPGATAPSTAVGAQTWQAKEKSTSGGTLTNLAASPSIKVT
jgi:subtilase family serine protease